MHIDVFWFETDQVRLFLLDICSAFSPACLLRHHFTWIHSDVSSVGAQLVRKWVWVGCGPSTGCASPALGDGCVPLFSVWSHLLPNMCNLSELLGQEEQDGLGGLWLLKRTLIFQQ